MINRISPEEYSEIFPNPSHVFNTVPFNELNRYKCDDIHYIVFHDSNNSKIRFGIILGVSGGILSSPFSAPFGGMEVTGTQRISHYIDAAKDLREYGERIGKKIEVTLPPEIYAHGSSIISSQIQVFLAVGGMIKYSDYNYHYNLREFQRFNENLWPNAKRNLNTALESGLRFEHCVSPDDRTIMEVYDVIYRNHVGQSYPVHMSYADVEDTRAVCDMDFFMVKNNNDITIASAIIYHTSVDGVQLIYWGDTLEFRSLRPMNFLAYKIIEHYYRQGKSFFDLGPASSNGNASLGLCDFKASLGCELSSKFTIEL